MPELPEVESFRQLLLPLVGNVLEIQLVGDHNRVKVDELVGTNSSTDCCMCTDILRRGKQICLVLSVSKSTKYMFLHMGMTGRIRVYGRPENWGERKEDATNVGHAELSEEEESSPPKYTYIIFSSPNANYTAYFCDPRKFGSAYLSNDLTDLHSLAPDALTCTDHETIQGHILPALTNQRLGIKAILLDQKRAVSGVGNWVADEVLYQCCTHPDQTKLVSNEAETIQQKLHEIMSIAVQSLENGESYPSHWLFHYRWTGKKNTKDANGRSITFITSGGRTTAVIASLQKLYARNTLLKSRVTKVETSADDADVSNCKDIRKVENDSSKKGIDKPGRPTQNRSSKQQVDLKLKDVKRESSFNTSYQRGEKRTNEKASVSQVKSKIKRQRKKDSISIRPQRASPNEGTKNTVITRRMSPRLNSHLVRLGACCEP
jgi:formamidopyrimidine-DNA glycosylase